MVTIHELRRRRLKGVAKGGQEEANGQRIGSWRDDPERLDT